MQSLLAGLSQQAAKCAVRAITVAFPPLLQLEHAPRRSETAPSRVFDTFRAVCSNHRGLSFAFLSCRRDLANQEGEKGMRYSRVETNTAKGRKTREECATMTNIIPFPRKSVLAAG